MIDALVCSWILIFWFTICARGLVMMFENDIGSLIISDEKEQEEESTVQVDTILFHRVFYMSGISGG